jgi:hypothetical protein
LKACGVVTAADPKRNPFMRKILIEISARWPIPLLIFPVPPTQFIHQMFKAG